LITTIFTPYTPLHDGAIIIRQDLIVAAGCMLPLSQNPTYLKMFGMRHKAGVGITEESDAVCIIISEETGAIAIAFEGALRRDIERSQFKEILMRFLGLTVCGFNFSTAVDARRCLSCLTQCQRLCICKVISDVWG
jgi:diadenylate cyclase